jgi:hypothetical protein
MANGFGLGSGASRPGAFPGVSPDGLREHEGTFSLRTLWRCVGHTRRVMSRFAPADLILGAACYLTRMACACGDAMAEKKQPAARIHDVGLHAERGSAGPTPATANTTISLQAKTQRTRPAGLRIRRSS